MSIIVFAKLIRGYIVQIELDVRRALSVQRCSTWEKYMGARYGTTICSIHVVLKLLHYIT